MKIVFYLLNYYFNQKNNKEKLHYLNNIKSHNIQINEVFSELFKKGELFINEYINTHKILFLDNKIIASIMNTSSLGNIGYVNPLRKFMLTPEIEKFMDKIDIDDILYELYFKEFIETLNNAIDTFDLIKNNFEELI